MDSFKKIQLLNQVDELNEIEKEKIKFLDNYLRDDSYIKSKCNLFKNDNPNPLIENISLPDDQIELLNQIYKKQNENSELLIKQKDHNQLLLDKISEEDNLKPKLNTEKLKLMMITSDDNNIMKELLLIKNKLNILENICDK